jgi:hypothetical protein
LSLKAIGLEPMHRLQGGNGAPQRMFMSSTMVPSDPAVVVLG